MSEFGVMVVVIQDDTVLLTKREDFEVWCLPGGAVEAHEAVDQAAVREVLEETGLQVQLTHYVGLLNKPRWGRSGIQLAVFAARPVTLTLNADPAEVQALAYFPVDRLPEPLSFSSGFYQTLGSGESVERACQISYIYMRSKGYKGLKPVLLKKKVLPIKSSPVEVELMQMVSPEMITSATPVPQLAG